MTAPVGLASFQGGEYCTLFDPARDSLRYYHLGANWRRRIEHVGAKPGPDLGGTLIV